MKEWTWLVLGLISALTAAGVALFGRLGMSRADPVLATTLRSIIMTATLFAALAATGLLRTRLGEVEELTGREWLFITLAPVCGAASWLAYFAALRLGAAGQVAAVDRLSVVFVFVLAALFLGERYSWKGWVGVALMVAGVFLIAGDAPQAPPESQPPRQANGQIADG
jgi:bacterial/archaeal transporter family protein